MRPLVVALDGSFERISTTSRELIAATPDEILFRDPRGYASTVMCSVGEYVVRSGAMIERAFGGITTRLWDDPFEWTLPEKLFDPDRIAEYLDEVDEIRRRGLSFVSGDDSLAKQIPAPVRMKSIHEILLEAISLASHYQGRAFALLQVLSDQKVPRV
jgi:hypothetical protein